MCRFVFRYAIHIPLVRTARLTHDACEILHISAQPFPARVEGRKRHFHLRTVAILFGTAGLVSVTVGICLKPLPAWVKILVLIFAAALAIGLVGGAIIQASRR